MEPTCPHCHGPVGTTPKRGRPRLFCSKACKEAHRAEQQKAERAERLVGRMCIVCGAAIESRNGRAKTCSPACGIKYQNDRRQQGRREAWEATNPTCAECGEPIPATRRVGVKYCSWDCKHKAMNANWRARAPHYMRQYIYGITAEQFASLLEAQDGRCAICRTDTPNGKGGWHVDHCHDSDKIRGLLCHYCNVGLGNFRDDPALVRAAAEYLEMHV